MSLGQKMKPRPGKPRPGPICGSNWRTSNSRRWLPVRSSIPKSLVIVRESCRMIDRYPRIARETGTQEDNPPVIRQVSPPRWLVHSCITRPPPFQNVLFRYCRSQSRRLRGFARPVALRRRDPSMSYGPNSAPEDKSNFLELPFFFVSEGPTILPRCLLSIFGRSLGGRGWEEIFAWASQGAFRQ